MPTLQILQAPQVRGSLQFVGSNSVGPQITMVLTSVLLTPGSQALALIGDGFGEFQLDGEVLADISTGSFGSITLPDGQTQPDIANYYIGKGIVSWKGVSDPAYADLGDVSKFEFTPEIKVLDHYSSRLGIKTKDDTVVQEKSAKVSLTMGEWTADNFKLVLMAQ